MRARQIAVTDGLATADMLTNPSYTDAFTIPIGQNTDRSPERWMRAVFEDAPRALRWLVLAGWTLVLGFRPGPQHSPEHILGWPIVSQNSESITLRQHSGLMQANLVLRIRGERLVLASFVRHKHPAARPIWFIVGLVHRQLVPYALKHAAKRARVSAG